MVVAQCCVSTLRVRIVPFRYALKRSDGRLVLCRRLRRALPRPGGVVHAQGEVLRHQG